MHNGILYLWRQLLISSIRLARGCIYFYQATFSSNCFVMSYCLVKKRNCSIFLRPLYLFLNENYEAICVPIIQPSSLGRVVNTIAVLETGWLACKTAMNYMQIYGLLISPVKERLHFLSLLL